MKGDARSFFDGAVAMLVSHAIEAVIVVDQGRLMGRVPLADLCRCLWVVFFFFVVLLVVVSLSFSSHAARAEAGATNFV